MYPLTLQLRDEGGGAKAAINGDGSHGGSVTVLPVIPGAIVTPPSMEISTATGSEARFWVTPLALGKLRDARIELRTGSTIHETVPLVRSPDWLVIIIGLLLTGPIIPVLYFLSYSKYPKVRRGWWPWILLALTFLLPLLLYFAKEYQWTPSVRLHIDKSKVAPGKSLDEAAPSQPSNEANPMGGVRPNDRETPPAKTEDKPKEDKPKEDSKPGDAKKEEPKKEEPRKEESNKQDEKKPNTSKPVEDKKAPEKKVEEKQPDEKKPDDKKSEDKPAIDALSSEDPLENEEFLALSWEQPGSDEEKPAGATKDEAKTPPAKRPTGPGQGGAPRGGRSQGQPPSGGGARPSGGPPAPPGLPPPPADGGVEPPKVTYFGEDAINRGLDYEMKRREGTRLEDYDTKDLAVYGLASIKGYLTWGYRNLYELPRNMQYSELILFALLAILTAVYCTLFGPARARRVGRVIELPAA